MVLLINDKYYIEQGFFLNGTFAAALSTDGVTRELWPTGPLFILFVVYRSCGLVAVWAAGRE